MLERLRKWLACVDSPAAADLIFVLAGREIRKIYGLQLLQAGLAPRITFSVARFEIRKFKNLPLPVEFDLLPIAMPTPPALRHFFVTFRGNQLDFSRIRIGAFGTLGEIDALASFLANRGEIRSLLVVTSSAHVRRVRLCCRAILARSFKFHIIAAPEYNQENDSVGESVPMTSQEETPWDIFVEAGKLALYRIVLAFRRRPSPSD